MKLVDLNCPRCGGDLKVDIEKQNCICEFCNAKLLIDNNTLLQDSHNYGYNFEKGRQQAEIERNKNRKNVKLTPAYHRNKPQSACYVATCVYGSYDCPEVWTLRRYRDYSLAETWYGRAFIRTYYTISPTIVKMFGDRKGFRNFFRRRLDKIVSDLQKKGFDSSPYNDRKL